MTRLSREDRRVLTVSKLRQAAMKEVAQTGFSAATIDRITETAGFSRGAFYSNFKSKDELILELLEQDNGAEMDAWQEIIRSAADMESMYAQMAERFAAYAAKTDWNLFFLEVQLHAKRNAVFRGHYREHMQKTDERVKQLIQLLFARTRRAPPMDSALLAISLRNYATALSMQACRDDDLTSPEKMAELIVLFLKGLVLQGMTIMGNEEHEPALPSLQMI